MKMGGGGSLTQSGKREKRGYRRRHGDHGDWGSRRAERSQNQAAAAVPSSTTCGTYPPHGCRQQHARVDPDADVGSAQPVQVDLDADVEHLLHAVRPRTCVSGSSVGNQEEKESNSRNIDDRQPRTFVVCTCAEEQHFILVQPYVFGLGPLLPVPQPQPQSQLRLPLSRRCSRH